ncbi:MAG: sigma-70 family RNA polymerase sigma factor [Terracidiphilus sp.]|nr:sigma-70 family RNA polymerase sigma factor [Terracidiphilus sp.]
MENGSSGAANQLDEFRRGSLDAFEALFRLHQRAVYGWILRIVRNPAAAEDLTIETFFRIHQAHARFQPALGFEAWARRIATHAALDWLRAAHAECELPVELAAPEAANPGVSAEIRSATALAFGRLPPRLRIAATLAVIEQQPQKEVAEALGISVAAVKLRVFRALRLLRKDLASQGITP